MQLPCSGEDYILLWLYVRVLPYLSIHSYFLKTSIKQFTQRGFMGEHQKFQENVVLHLLQPPTNFHKNDVTREYFENEQTIFLLIGQTPCISIRVSQDLEFCSPPFMFITPARNLLI